MEKVKNLGENIIRSPYTLALIALVVALYGTLLQVNLPHYISKLFHNEIFRLIFLSLLLIYNFKQAPHVAIMIALIFLITMHYVSEVDNRNIVQLKYAWNKYYLHGYAPEDDRETLDITSKLIESGASVGTPDPRLVYASEQPCYKTVLDAGSGVGGAH